MTEIVTVLPPALMALAIAVAAVIGVRRLVRGAQPAVVDITDAPGE
jgi:hypothetical protein